MSRLAEVVTYRSRTGGYDLAAIVTGTRDSVTDAGVASGDVRQLSSPSHVHLQVFTPGKARHYQEFDVPQDDPGATSDVALLEAGVAAEPQPGHWRHGL